MNRKIEKEIIRLVDDDEDQRKALRFLLEAAGYEVRDYPSGRDFLVNDEPSAHEAPDAEALEACRSLGKALI